MVLPYALFVIILILILGLAFMQTSATESLVTTRTVQRLQANAAAEYGIARARAMADSRQVRRLVFDDLQRQSPQLGARAPPTADTTSATCSPTRPCPLPPRRPTRW